MLRRAVILISLSFVSLIQCLNAQTTAFNYQGRLTDAGNPAMGAFQMQFKLFDSLAGAGQVGSTIADVPVTVTAGTFSVKLDFGANALSGANRWLEIAVRRNSGESYVTLSPREQIASSPYAVRTLSSTTADNALSLGGVPASEYVTNANVGGSFIRNGTTLQTANFNISGNGFLGGSVGIGPATLNHRLNIAAPPCWTGDCWGGAVGLENASAIGWKANTSGVRFGIGRTENGLFFFRTNAELGTTAGGPTYDFKMDNTGNVGIGNLGISTNLTGAKLNVLTLPTSYGFTHSDGTVTVGSQTGGRTLPPVIPTGGWLGTRTNHPLYFFTNDARPTMTVGNDSVGIGTTSPTSKLMINGSGSDGYSLKVSGDTGFGGNVTQPRDKSGIVKAMASVNSAGAVLRCYNGITNSASGGCGFTVARTSAGIYEINFGFQVDDRFIGVTNMRVFGCAGGSAEVDFLSTNVVRVSIVCGSAFADEAFMIFVY